MVSGGDYRLVPRGRLQFHISASNLCGILSMVISTTTMVCISLPFELLSIFLVVQSLSCFFVRINDIPSVFFCCFFFTLIEDNDLQNCRSHSFLLHRIDSLWWNCPAYNYDNEWSRPQKRETRVPALHSAQLASSWLLVLSRSLCLGSFCCHGVCYYS